METKQNCTIVKELQLILKTDWFCMQGVEKSQLAEDMDWLISELKVRQKDVGFTGEPEEVIHYASLLLGENLVTRFVEGRNFIVNKIVTKLCKLRHIKMKNITLLLILCKRNIIQT